MVVISCSWASELFTMVIWHDRAYKVQSHGNFCSYLLGQSPLGATQQAGNYNRIATIMFILKMCHPCMWPWSTGMILNQSAYLTKSPGMTLFWCELKFYHVNRPSAKFGVKKMTLVAWAGAQPLFWSCSSIDRALAPSPRVHRSSFHPRSPTSILLLRCLLVLNVETRG